MNQIRARDTKKRDRVLGLSIALAGMVLGLYFSINSFFSVNALAAQHDNVPSKTLEKAFPHSNKCKRCHLRAYEEWETSAQSRSIQTAVFRVTLDQFLKSIPDDQQNMCFQCHAPHILEYPHLVNRFIDEVKSRDPQIDGVGCS